MHPEEPPLTSTEAAAYLGVARQTIHQLVSAAPDFPKPTYVGRTPQWSRAQLDEWRAQHPARRRRPPENG